MPDVNAPFVANLLQQSRLAHQRYRDNRPKAMPSGVGVVTMPGDPDKARAALLEAQRLRVEAHTADPKHEAPAWFVSERTHPHAELTAFYVSELAK